MVVGSACSQPPSTVGQASPGSTHAQRSPNPVITPTLPGLAEARCVVATPAAWTTVIRQSSPRLPAGSRVIPFATGIDPSLFFAELYSASWSGVVAVAAPAGTVTHIAAFKDPSSEQAYAGAFDGHWLVWVDSLSPQDTNDWQIWAWDSVTKHSFEVGVAATINGAPVSGPIVQPAIWSGMAAWVQANQAGIGEVHLFSLQSRNDRIVGSGATNPVLFWGSELIWQHLDVPGESGHLQMLDVVSGKPVTAPEQLGSLRHLSSLAVSDSLIAWTDSTSIWAYRPGKSSVSLVYELTNDTAGFLGIAGNLITWDGSSQPFALDVRSGAVTKLTPAYGGRFASGMSLLIYWPDSKAKATSPQFVVSDVDTSKLPPLPSCS
jgi:hypothetical protein